jgi:hypothetical protein
MLKTVASYLLGVVATLLLLGAAALELTDRHLRAIYRYLMTLSPVENDASTGTHGARPAQPISGRAVPTPGS